MAERKKPKGKIKQYPTTEEIGRLGGFARAKKLSKAQRSRQSKAAAIARWKKVKGPDYKPETDACIIADMAKDEIGRAHV